LLAKAKEIEYDLESMRQQRNKAQEENRSQALKIDLLEREIDAVREMKSSNAATATVQRL
jgi:hypothetical protein